MLRDPNALSEAFAGTVLEGRKVRQLGRCRVLPDVSDLDVRTAWQAARDALPRPGRWPLAMTSWSDDPTELWLGEPGPAQVEQFTADLEGRDPWSDREVWVDDLPVEADELRRWWGGRFPAELIDRALRELPMPTTVPAWDRWLFTELQRDPALQALVPVDDLVGTQRWFDPESWVLVLLPTDRSELAPLYADFHGGTGPGLGAVLRDWRDRWGAELVASWGTMLQLLVARPPQDLESAYELAGQIKTVAGSEQSMRYELALALTRSDAWFLHDRP